LAGKTTRVALVWENDPNYNYTLYRQPSADLDLQVYNPAGDVEVGWGASYDNTQEVTEFVAPVSGNYTIKVVKWRCDKPVTRIALAATQDP
jgi:hypothetical protein